LIDPVCPPEGIFATINALKGPKKVIIMPRSTHGNDGEPHNAYYAAYGPFLNEHKGK
jgi:cephalosporin-C deacetylase-like acetyl esterase